MAHIHFRGTEPSYARSYDLMKVVQCLSCREHLVHNLNILRHGGALTAQSKSQLLRMQSSLNAADSLIAAIRCAESAAVAGQFVHIKT